MAKKSEPVNPAADNQVNPDPVTDQAPASPAIVKRTQMRTPKELDLEKQLKAMQTKQSALEDRLDGFSDALKGVNDFLEGVFPGGKKPSASGPSKTVFDELADDIFG